MTDDLFISYGQNHEDVVLWRALQAVPAGRYVEVGANDPTTHSITRAFYDRGWSGLTIEPVPAFAALHREQRPRDRQIEAAVTDAEGADVTLHVFPGTGLSTLVDSIEARHVDGGWDVEDLTVPTARLDALLEATGWGRGDIQFLVVDVEGAESSVLSTIDLTAWRPWVLVIEATLPLTVESSAAEWEPQVLAAGYEFCLFDGVSRFYLAKEHIDLKPALSYPACALDDFMPAREYSRIEQHAADIDRIQAEFDAQVAQLTSVQAQELATLREERAADLADTTRQLLFWRARALQAWAAPVAGAGSTPLAGELAAANAEISRLLEHIAVMEGTVSWRVTAPLRVVRKAQMALIGPRR